MTPRNLAPPATLALFLVTVITYLVQVLVGGNVVERAVGLIPACISNSMPERAQGVRPRTPTMLH